MAFVREVHDVVARIVGSAVALQTCAGKGVADMLCLGVEAKQAERCNPNRCDSEGSIQMYVSTCLTDTLLTYDMQWLQFCGGSLRLECYDSLVPNCGVDDAAYPVHEKASCQFKFRTKDYPTM